MTELEDITISTDQAIYVVDTVEEGNRVGTMWPYPLATSYKVSERRLMVVAGDEVLDTYPRDTWDIHKVRLAAGTVLPQRDGRLVTCRSAAEVSP